MLKHHITKYRDGEGNKRAVSWLQLNIIGKSYCFNKKEIAI